MAAPSGVAVAPRGPALPLAAVVLLALALVPSVAAAAAGRRGARACTYTLRVKTSCASPPRTSDTVAVAFGDAYRNEAGAPRLPAGSHHALERCVTDAFRVAGPCGYGVCYLYLRRAGRDGWAPEWVQIVQSGPRAGDAPTTATFYFGDPLPDGVWYGHDRCPKAKTASAAADGDNAARPAATAAADAPRASNSSASPQG